MSRPDCWDGATRLWIGGGALDAALADLPRVPAVLVVDHGVRSSETGRALLRRVRDGVPAGVAHEHVVTGSPVAGELPGHAEQWRRARAGQVVAVGGGCTLDTAALGALAPAELSSPRLWSGRAGVVVLRSPRESAMPALHVPTTLGTGAEASAGACCDTPSGKVLLLGEALRPRAAALDPCSSAGLPEGLVREAVLENVARLLVPFTRPTPEPTAVAPLADRLVLAQLAQAGALAAALSADPVSGPDHRVQVAALSAHSHAGWGHLGRAGSTSPVWFVATELSAVTGLRKVPATAALLPVWARHVDRGTGGWGWPERLLQGWHALRSGWPALPSAPAEGLAVLVHELCGGVPTPLPAPVRRRVVARCTRRWGAGLPMLAGISELDVAALLRDVDRHEVRPPERHRHDQPSASTR